MDQIQREKVLEKLGKIKALAERGVGGEKETAMRMYEELKQKYDISPDEAEAAMEKLEKRWFSYRTEIEERLLVQIFYKVTGDVSFYEYTGRYKRRKKKGVICTEIEAAEIQMLFNFYREELKKELDTFMSAFIACNDIYPDETARIQREEQKYIGDRSREDIRRLKKIAFMSEFMDKATPPRAAIEDTESGVE